MSLLKFLNEHCLAGGLYKACIFRFNVITFQPSMHLTTKHCYFVDSSHYINEAVLSEYESRQFIWTITNEIYVIYRHNFTLGVKVPFLWAFNRNRTTDTMAIVRQAVRLKGNNLCWASGKISFPSILPFFFREWKQTIESQLCPLVTCFFMMELCQSCWVKVQMRINWASPWANSTTSPG